jgi:uncharacterized protein YjiS (DUF1127 family)
MPKTAVHSAPIFATGHTLSLRMSWWRRVAYRAQLRDLLARGPHLVSDMGLTVEEAEREAGAPFWQYRDPAMRLF